MLKQDRKDEEGTIKLYRQVIELAQKEKDHTTARIFRRLLQEEEEHLDTFQGLLEGMK